MKRRKLNTEVCTMSNMVSFLNTLPDTILAYKIPLFPADKELKCPIPLRLPYLHHLEITHPISHSTVLTNTNHFLPCLESFVYCISGINSIAFLKSVLKHAPALHTLDITLPYDFMQLLLDSLSSIPTTKIRTLHLSFVNIDTSIYDVQHVTRLASILFPMLMTLHVCIKETTTTYEVDSSSCTSKTISSETQIEPTLQTPPKQ